MQQAFAHCQQLVRAADKDRFLATLFAPAAHRPALFALYAFNLEVARLRDAVQQPLAGEIRLQWWRDVLAGERQEEARANPVAAALLDVLARYPLPADALDQIAAARIFDLYDEPMATLDALEHYARQTSALLMHLAARILGGDVAPEALRFAAPAGIAVALTGLLRGFPRHAARGQLFLPLELLARHGVDPDDVLAGQASDGLRAALAELRGHARRHWLAALAPPPALAPAWLPAALVPLYLAALERREDPFAGTAEVPQWRRQWALWRAARRPPDFA
jgi:phytoene synthase